MNLVLLGAPGAGKGFHAQLLSDKLKIPTISTGELIRDRIKVGDNESKVLEKYVSDGALVPDELICNILQNRVKQSDCEKGFILDGFPRSLSQAKILDELCIDVDLAVEIVISDDKIFERLLNRRVCSKCGATFNLILKNSKVENVCDFCHGKLIQREDDNVSTIEQRLEVFRKQTGPVRDFYKSVDKYYKINGEMGSEYVQEKLFEIIGEFL